MSDLQNMADLVSTGNQLLDDIRGGAISRMAHEHQTQQAEFKSEHDAIVQQQTAAGDAKIDEINDYIANGRDKQTHVRLSKNQALLPNPTNDFPNLWSTGYVKRATLLETVSTQTQERTPLAREFLAAINSDQYYFAGKFNIWEIEIYPNRRGEQSHLLAYFLNQYVRYSQHVTVAAVVKHVSGVVPDGSFCTGLQEKQSAKLVGTYVPISTKRNHYDYFSAYVRGENLAETETTVIQIALPAVVTGYVDLSQGAWGQFPFIGDGAYD
ncbi:hypothetical protein [Pseudoalteromonas maricaloris]|uniref:hypothetical protein n=1 Tax=Pseudoalteromonas maricaloris TaxID=184924 RepID=UPI003C23DE18